MSLKKTQEELDNFLSGVDVVKADMALVHKRLEDLFNTEKGQKLLSLSLDVFTKTLEAHIAEKGQVNNNDKVNILGHVLVVLEQAGYLDIKVKKDARKETKGGAKKGGARNAEGAPGTIVDFSERGKSQQGKPSKS